MFCFVFIFLIFIHVNNKKDQNEVLQGLFVFYYLNSAAF